MLHLLKSRHKEQLERNEFQNVFSLCMKFNLEPLTLILERHNKVWVEKVICEVRQRKDNLTTHCELFNDHFLVRTAGFTILLLR